MRHVGRCFLFVAAVVATAGVCIVLVSDRDARAQIAKAVRIVVPYAPGGAADIVARLVAEQVGRSGGPAIVVENRPGAGGAVGTETVARAVPDGNTALVVSTPFLIDPLLRTLNYDPINNFTPICNLVTAPTVIVVNGASSYRTLAELLDDAHAKPGQITMASIGPASSFQLGFEMLKRAAKVDMTFVPYPGNAPALNAVLGQQVTSMFGTYPNVSEYLKAGKLRALAVGNGARAQPLPDVPTVAESGYRDFDSTPGLAPSLRQTRPRPRLGNSNIYSRRRCKMRALRKSYLSRACFRSAPAVQISPPIWASSMTPIAALLRKPTSKPTRLRIIAVNKACRNSLHI